MLAFDMDRELDFYVKHGYCPNDAGLTIQWAFEDLSLADGSKNEETERGKVFQKRSMAESFHPEAYHDIPRSENGDSRITDLCWKRGLFKPMHGRLSSPVARYSGFSPYDGRKDSLAVVSDEAFRKSQMIFCSAMGCAESAGLSLSAHVFSRM